MFAVVGIAGLWLLLCHYRLERHYRCSSCLADRTETQWFVGVMPLGYSLLRDYSGGVQGPGALRLSTMKVEIEPSAAGIRLFPPDHQHSWQFAQASPYYLFGKRWGGCVIGGSRHLSPFAFAYLRDPGFPTFVDDLVRRGLYDRNFFSGLFQDDGNSPASEAFRSGRRIAQEYWATHPNPGVEATFRELYGAAV